jgi:hypothetical protein
MKRLRKICATFLFIFMLALPALAGDMGAGGFAGDPPPPGWMGDPPPPGDGNGSCRAGDPEPPGSTGDPEPPGRSAGGMDYSLTLWLALQSIFIR